MKNLRVAATKVQVGPPIVSKGSDRDACAQTRQRSSDESYSLVGVQEECRGCPGDRRSCGGARRVRRQQLLVELAGSRLSRVDAASRREGGFHQVVGWSGIPGDQA